jgi:hypothetical protein
MVLSESYLKWNRAIAEYYFLETSDNVYLTITPRILSMAISKYCEKIVSPDEAERDFVKTVSEVYRNQVKTNGLKFTFQTTHGRDHWPKCIGFLALSVLAAYKMCSDKENGANAYYKRLADLLKCKLDGGFPEGFDPLQFKSLWEFFQNKLGIVSSETESSSKRYIVYPLSHVPLRQIDVEKLPEFFTAVGYEPESRISHDKINADLKCWNRLDHFFSKPGQAALNDNRRKVAITEIAKELEFWDGAVEEGIRRSTTVEILLEVRNRQPRLYYLPRQPPQFPAIFDDGINRFESGEEGWYSLSKVTHEHGEALLNGFSWESTVERTQFVLKRSATRVIGFSPSNNYSGYLSRPKLICGAPCSVLVHESLLEQTKNYLNTITGSLCEASNHRELPKDWYLFSNLKVERCPESLPPELSMLDVESKVDIITFGGLKLGRRNVWLLGSHPRLIVTGLEKGQQPKIDGEAVAIADNGLLIDENNALSKLGVHTVEIGSFSKKIEIIEPEVSNISTSWIPSHSNVSIPIALPKGSWKLIGAIPGELFEASSDSWNGFIISCPFQPVWAVSITKRLQMPENDLPIIELEEIAPCYKNIKVKDFSPNKCNPSYHTLRTISRRLGCDVDDLSQLDNKGFLHFMRTHMMIKVIPLAANPSISISSEIQKEDKETEEWVSFIHNAGLCNAELIPVDGEISIEKSRRIWDKYTAQVSLVKKILWKKKQ